MLVRPAIWLALTATACGTASHRTTRPAAPAPLSPEAYAHYLRGKIAIFEGDYPAAVRQLRAARAAAPDEAPIAVALVDALVRAGHRDRARRAVERAQRRWPRSPDVWLAGGELHARLGDDAAARRSFEHAIALDRDLERAYLGLAAVWIQLHSPARAEATYRALLDRAPDSIAGNYRLALRLAARGAHARAVDHLRRVLDLEPDHLTARVELSRSLRAIGRHHEAIATLRLAFDRSHGDARVGEQLVTQLLEAGERASAVALLAQIDRDDLSTSTRLSFGYKYLQIGETSAAAAVADSVLAERPASAHARLLKAEALVAAGRSEQAVELLLEVPPGRPGYAECRALAAELLARAGHERRAIDAIEQALAVAPRDAHLIAGHARAYELAGNPGRARRIFQAAVRAPARAASEETARATARPTARASTHTARRSRPRDDLTPDDIDLLYAYAAFEDRQGRPDRAVSLMQRILRARPDHAGALNFIGYSLADRRIDLPRARRLLERALERAPDDGFVLDSYGWLLFRLGRLDDAQEVLSRAARLLPTEPDILWHLAELYLARRDRRRALELLVKARSFDPETRTRARIDARIQALGTGK